MKTKTIIFILIAFLYTSMGFAQEMNKSLLDDFSKSDLTKLLTEASKKELKKANELDKKAKVEKVKAAKTLKKAAGYQVKAAKKKRYKKKALKTRQKGIKQMSEVSKLYGQAAQLRYNVYSKNLNKVSEEGNPVNNKFASDSENSASQYFEEAKTLRSSISRTSDDEELEIQMSDALSFEQNALDALLETYAIYKATDNLEVISEPEDDTIEDDTAEKTEKVDHNVIFQVQILALNEGPLSDADLKEMFDIDNEIIWKDVKNGWYKYRIGKFSTARSAINYCDRVKSEFQVQDAFVVALKNGNRITVAEAKSLIGED